MNWFKNYFIISFVLMIVSYLAPGEKYKEYYKFFTGLLLALLLVVPMLDFMSGTSTDIDWQGWDKVQEKIGEIEFKEGEVDFEEILFEGFVSREIEKE